MRGRQETPRRDPPHLRGRAQSTSTFSRRFGISLLTVLLASCQTTHYERWPAYRNGCGGYDDARPWQLARDLPSDLERFRALADAHPNFPTGKQTYPIESWFSLPTGELMLCRTMQRPTASATGEWWQFERHGEDIRISAQDGWVVVT